MQRTDKYKNLILFTNCYPFGWQETVFLQNEIKIASLKFEKIFIIYQQITGELQPLPSNVKFFNLKDFDSPLNIFDQIRFTFSFFANWFIEFISNKASKVRLNILKNIRKDFSLYKNQFWNFKKLRHLLKANNIKSREWIFYTYWFDASAVMINFLKKEFNVFYITRAHGFDLYKERSPHGYISFRNIHINTADKIFCVSKFGSDYLKEEYKKQAGKIFFSRLGSKDYAINPFIKEKHHIVSCSTLSEIKRVPLIIDILKEITDEVTWTHIGGERYEADNLIKKASYLPKNIRFNYMGELDNLAVLNFYKNTSISLFVNVSSSEGLPMSIIEAISFGIPIIATDVGGTKEVVVEQTGVLLAKDFKSKEAAKLISDFFLSSRNSKDFRKNVRKYWEDNYNCENNFTKFYDQILQ